MLGIVCGPTEQRDALQHGSDLLHGALSQAACVVEAAEAVHPLQEPAPLRLGLPVELLQQLGGHREVTLQEGCKGSSLSGGCPIQKYTGLYS